MVIIFVLAVAASVVCWVVIGTQFFTGLKDAVTGKSKKPKGWQ